LALDCAPATPTSAPSSGGCHAASARRQPGHSIRTAAWHILTHDIDYTDRGADWFARNVNNDHRRNQAIRNLHELGYRVTLEKVP
jgi:hypothetical protein